MGRRSFHSVIPTFSLTGKRGPVPSGGRLHARLTNRKSLSVTVGTQTVPRSLALSFYSILKDSPVFIDNLCGESFQERKQLLPFTVSRDGRCWQLEHLPSARWTITTPTASFQYPGLSKRGYVSSPKPQSSVARTHASDEPADKPVKKCGQYTFFLTAVSF